MRSASNLVALGLALMLLVASCAASPDRHVELGEEMFDEEAYKREHAAWQVVRVEELKAPNSWLSLAGLFWLQEGANTLGSSPDSDVRFPAHAPDRVGVVTVTGGQASLQLEENLDATVGDQPFRSGKLDPGDYPDVPPDLVEMPPFSFKLMVRGDGLALRLFDRKAPTLSGFKGIETFPLDRQWRVTAAYTEFQPPRVLEVSTAISTTEQVTVPGEFSFVVAGDKHTLLPFSYPGAEELYLMFGDKTNGKSTYGGGRFVLVPRPLGDTGIIDFNRAYNPPCAYTKYATCPIPRPENRLGIPVTAGEKYSDH